MTIPSLTTIAARLARLAPHHRDPERFHVEKSELVAAIRRHAENERSPPTLKHSIHSG